MWFDSRYFWKDFDLLLSKRQELVGAFLRRPTIMRLISENGPTPETPFDKIYRIGVLCNNAYVNRSTETKKIASKKYSADDVERGQGSKSENVNEENPTNNLKFTGNASDIAILK